MLIVEYNIKSFQDTTIYHQLNKMKSDFSHKAVKISFFRKFRFKMKKITKFFNCFHTLSIWLIEFLRLEDLSIEIKHIINLRPQFSSGHNSNSELYNV